MWSLLLCYPLWYFNAIYITLNICSSDLNIDNLLGYGSVESLNVLQQIPQQQTTANKKVLCAQELCPLIHARNVLPADGSPAVKADWGPHEWANEDMLT
jgi:hypothetical protein